MKIGSSIAGWTVGALMPVVDEPGNYIAVGSRPGNKRPVYAVLRLSGYFSGHGTTTEPLALYTDHDQTASERLRLARADAMRRSGWAKLLFDSMAMA